MSWDKDIPIPTKAPKWDFEGADLGHSMGFETKEEAGKCAVAFRRWAQKNDKLWSPLVDTSFCSGWRMWIVEKRACRPKIIREDVVQSERMKSSVLQINVIPAPEIVAANISTDTDDDIMLSTDTRRGGSVVIGKQPEARPIEVQDEITETGRRRKRRVSAE